VLLIRKAPLTASTPPAEALTGLGKRASAFIPMAGPLLGAPLARPAQPRTTRPAVPSISSVRMRLTCGPKLVGRATRAMPPLLPPPVQAPYTDWLLSQNTVTGLPPGACSCTQSAAPFPLAPLKL
jgi:predicted permease